MSSLNKFELNKLIVSMRHNVKRAKVHTVSKLCRSIKALKNKNVPENLKKKNEKKAERLVDEVLVMKKIPSDEIAAFSLGNTKQVDKILSDTESSLRLKALARLSTHKSISPIVKQFHLKYPAWQNEFPKVLIALKKREKLNAGDKSNKKKSKEAVEMTKSVPDLNEEEDNNGKDSSGSENELLLTEENIVESENEELQSEENLSESEDEISESRNGNSMNVNDSVVLTRGNRFSVSSDDFNISEISENQSTKNIISNKKTSKFDKCNSKLKNEKVNNSVLSEFCAKSNNVEEPTFDDKPIVSKQITKNVMSNIVGKRKYENPPAIQITKQKIDPFFLSSDNKPYKTIDTVFNKNTQNNSSSDEEITSFDNMDESKGKKMKQFNTKNNRTHFNLKEDKNVKKFDKGKNFKNNKFNDNKSRENKAVQEKSLEKLHPSWAAKKKITTIANFEGKKIVFD